MTMISLFAEYGPDFLAKLPLYRTAKFQGEYVALLAVDTKALRVVVRRIDGRQDIVPVTSLSNFVL